MPLYDVSIPIHPKMPIYPGDPGVSFDPACSVETGSCANVTNVSMGSQTGTHYDAPHHILNNGITMDQLPLELFYGPAQVIAIPADRPLIKADDLANVTVTAPRVLFKTSNSKLWSTHPETFITEFVALAPSAAQWLVDRQVQLVGIDYLSVEPFDTPTLDAHHILMNANITILEGLNLSAVEAGHYLFAGFPLAYQGLDGAPARVVLIKD